MKKRAHTYLLLLAVLISTLGLTCNRVPELSRMPIGPALDSTLGEGSGWVVLQLEDGRLLLLYATKSARKWYCSIGGEWCEYDVEQRLFRNQVSTHPKGLSVSNSPLIVVSNVCILAFDQIMADMTACSGLILKSGKDACLLYRDKNDGSGYASMHLDLGMGRFSILMTNAEYRAVASYIRSIKAPPGSEDKGAVVDK
jgi:hypothetical protein